MLFSTTGHTGLGDVLTRTGVLQSSPAAPPMAARDSDDEGGYEDVVEEGWLVAADARVRACSAHALARVRTRCCVAPIQAAPVQPVALCCIMICFLAPQETKNC
jgi:hypothetical protein